MDWMNGWKVKNLTTNILMNTKNRKMKQPIKQQENEFPQTTCSLKRKMNWWREQSSEGDKGGSFNLELYLDYLERQDFNVPLDQQEFTF